MLDAAGVPLMEIFLFWVVFSILVAVYADKKGRSGVGFFFLALLASPLIGFLVALAVEPKRETVPVNAGMKKCPDCGEYVRGEARICRFCRHEFWAEPVESLPSNEDAAPQSSDSEVGSKEAVVPEADSTTPIRLKIFLGLVAIFVIAFVIWFTLTVGHVGH